MLSCVALGSLLAATAAVRELVVAALLVAALDLALMHAGGIRIATAALLDAHVGDMPDFAQPVLGRMTIGYGDFFVAALAGAIAARRPSRQTLSLWPPPPSRWPSTRSPATATCCPRPCRSPWPWRWPRSPGACAGGAPGRPPFPPYSSLC
jgi:hypothetical protein